MTKLISTIFYRQVGLFFITMLGLYSCNINSNDNKNLTQNSDSTQTKPIGKVVGQIYFFAPELDSATVKATGGCDCCSSNLLFLNDSVFVAVDYCIGNDTYYKGTYKVHNNSISFRCDSLRVDREENWETETDTTGKDLPPFFIKVRKDKNVEFTWTSFYFKNKLCFKTSFGDYSTPDNDEKKGFIATTKADSIWTKLELE